MKTFLRFNDLKRAGIVNNRVTLRNWIEKHGFPRPYDLGPNTRAWCEEEVDAYLASRRETADPKAA